MGTVIHKGMFVTCYNSEKFDAVYEMAKSLMPDRVTPAMDSPINFYKTFAIMPCGSKSGWGDAEDHDTKIQTLINYIRMYDEEDHNPFEYVVSEYGHDIIDRKREQELIEIEKQREMEYHRRTLEAMVAKMQAEANYREDRMKAGKQEALNDLKRDLLKRLDR